MRKERGFNVQILIVVAYGPLKGSTDTKVEDYWTERSLLVNKHRRGRQVLLTTDANAALFQAEPERVGHILSDKRNDGSAAFFVHASYGAQLPSPSSPSAAKVLRYKRN